MSLASADPGLWLPISSLDMLLHFLRLLIESSKDFSELVVATFLRSWSSEGETSDLNVISLVCSTELYGYAFIDSLSLNVNYFDGSRFLIELVTLSSRILSLDSIILSKSIGTKILSY